MKAITIVVCHARISESEEQESRHKNEHDTAQNREAFPISASLALVLLARPLAQDIIKQVNRENRRDVLWKHRGPLERLGGNNQRKVSGQCPQ